MPSCKLKIWVTWIKQDTNYIGALIYVLFYLNNSYFELITWNYNSEYVFSYISKFSDHKFPTCACAHVGNLSSTSYRRSKPHKNCLLLCFCGCQIVKPDKMGWRNACTVYYFRSAGEIVIFKAIKEYHLLQRAGNYTNWACVSICSLAKMLAICCYKTSGKWLESKIYRFDKILEHMHSCTKYLFWSSFYTVKDSVITAAIFRW